jgi:RNA polymerase subunit RPABC4/transcription elongation factor Spt4
LLNVACDTGDTMMTTCAQCKNPVARDAKTCPHCGTSSPHKYLWSDPRTILAFVVIIGIIVYMAK